MPSTEPQIRTIRESLIGVLSDFVKDAGFDQQLNLIVELTYELAEYREEGVSFFPNVYIVKRTDEADTLSIISPGAERIQLKSIAVNPGSASKILKDSAALAVGGWSVFIDVSEVEAKYGLFQSELLPNSLSSSDSMGDTSVQSGLALLIRNCARNCVELLAADGNRMEFGLTASRCSSVSVSNAFRVLSEKATSEITQEARGHATTYFRRIITHLCQRSHGTIVVVLLPGVSVVPELLNDGVILSQPIDLLGAFIELRREATAASLSRLSALEAVLGGMILSDGVTVLSSDGKIVAFRVFVKPSDDERIELNTINPHGGARTRAFELLKLRVGKSIACVFFRSQDGVTNCVE